MIVDFEGHRKSDSTLSSTIMAYRKLMEEYKLLTPEEITKKLREELEGVLDELD